MKKDKLCIIGLGYVGLPLAVLFSSKYDVVGYDYNSKRVAELKEFNDKTNEVSKTELRDSQNKLLRITSDKLEIRSANIYIITVPTPIDSKKEPDLSYLISATSTVASNLNKGDIVIYESTVFPGCTEEICIPIIEEKSGLKYNSDFFSGYSPERVNPGDKTHRIENITKVVSGSNSKTLNKINQLYSSVISAGTYKAKSIKIAEAAKVIENSQRDINIAFVNELSLIFNLMEIDTHDVLEAASTKWNFLNFKPGLVGGHCIGVDPYYLASKSNQLGHNPEIILAGRKINDQIPMHIANKINSLINGNINNAKTLILGASFKENCPDFRNSKVIDLANELINLGHTIDIFDPLVDKEEFFKEYKYKLIEEPGEGYDSIILAVAHTEFQKINLNKLKRNSESIIYDIKGFLPRNLITSRL